MRAFLQTHEPQWKAYRKTLCVLPPVLSGILWLIMMLYFLISYCTLPRLPNGALPQISLDYTKYPWISSIGALHMSAFQASAILVAILMVAGYATDYHLRRNLKPGSVFRVPKLAAAGVAAVFLVALTFVNVNDRRVLHLSFTSIQIFAMGIAKMFGFLQNHCLLRAAPDCRALRMGQRYRAVVGAIAIPAWSMAVIGMYGCQGPVATLPSTAGCFTIVTVAAPAEWILSFTFILLLFTIGYDNYSAEEIQEAILFRDHNLAEKQIPSRNSQESIVSSASQNDGSGSLEDKGIATLVRSQESLLQV